MNLQIDKTEIDDFFNNVFFEKHENLKYSYLFKMQCFLLNELNIFNSYDFKIAISEIAAGNKTKNGIKADGQFTRYPLKGFWKKHIFLPDYYSMNIISELLNDSSTTSKKIEKLFKEHIGEPFNNIKDELINLTVLDSINNRSVENRKTGEWLIYAEKQTFRYILTMANHKEGKNQKETDANIFARIERMCFNEYPELKPEGD